jgi:hypothetical protein
LNLARSVKGHRDSGILGSRDALSRALLVNEALSDPAFTR